MGQAGVISVVCLLHGLVVGASHEEAADPVEGRMEDGLLQNQDWHHLVAVTWRRPTDVSGWLL